MTMESKNQNQQEIPILVISSKKQFYIPLIINAIRLFIIGFALRILVDLVLLEYLSLAYPYLTLELLEGIKLWGLISFMGSSVLSLPILIWMKPLHEEKGVYLPKFVQIYIKFIALMQCTSILGIKMGVFLFLKLKKHPEEPSIKVDEIPFDAFKSYRLYLIASAVYILVFGTMFLGLYNFLQLISIDLIYPTITQEMLIIILLWLCICFMVPGLIFLILSFWMKFDQPQSLRDKQKNLLRIGAILSIGSIFGLTNSIKLLKNWDIIFAGNENGANINPT